MLSSDLYDPKQLFWRDIKLWNVCSLFLTFIRGFIIFENLIREVCKHCTYKWKFARACERYGKSLVCVYLSSYQISCIAPAHKLLTYSGCCPIFSNEPYDFSPKSCNKNIVARCLGMIAFCPDSLWNYYILSSERWIQSQNDILLPSHALYNHN